MTAVSLQHLYKSFAGKTTVKDLSFSVEHGEILGLIGRVERVTLLLCFSTLASMS